MRHVDRLSMRLALIVVLASCGCTGTPSVQGTAGSSSGSGRPELEQRRVSGELPEPGSYELPILMPATDGRVLDRQGNEHALARLFDDRVTVLSFIYTRCNDPTACPMATGVLREVHALSRGADDLARMQLVTFSFDPEFDDPETMTGYRRSLGRFEGGAAWRFLTTADPRDLQPVLRGYGLYVEAAADPNDPLGPINHSLRVYLIDGKGQIRAIYGASDLDAELVVNDVRTLLLEARS